MILTKIRNLLSELTETERRIGEYVLENPEEASHLTIDALASRCNAAASAVNRFCRAVGSGGYKELKIAIAKELGGMPATERLPAIKPSDDTETVFKKVFSTGINTLGDTLDLLDFDNIKRIVQKLVSAKRIFIFGIGTSSVIATDAAYRFSQIGLEAYAYTDVQFMELKASNMTNNDVGIFVSHSGVTRVTVETMRFAKEMGATTIAISSYEKSILCKESDMMITVYADELNYPVEAVSARVAHICIIDALMMTLGTVDYNKFSHHIQKRNRILDNIRY